MGLLVTWNMQGATGFGGSKWRQDVSRLFLQQGVDIACLQECGAPPGSGVPVNVGQFATVPPYVWAAFTWNLGSTRRPFTVYGLWMRTDPGGNRNNLAIVTATAPQSFLWCAGTNYGRPAIGARMAGPNNTSLDFYTLHACSGNGGGDGRTLLNNISNGGGTWFAAGDYNKDPNAWANENPAPPGVLCAHGDITHPGSGTLLDYAFASANARTGTVDGSLICAECVVCCFGCLR